MCVCVCVCVCMYIYIISFRKQDQRLNSSRDIYICVCVCIYIFISFYFTPILSSLIPSISNQVGLFLWLSFTDVETQTVKLSNLLSATEPGNGRARIQTTQDHWLQSPHSSPAKAEVTKVK